jgi:hemoglobin
MKQEINDFASIQLLVDSFYAEVRKDELIGPIFNRVIGDHWPTHLEKMYRFWQTVLLNERAYQGSPFMPHMQLPIDRTHFERWLMLFRKTVRAHFHGAKAEEACFRAERMAEMFQHKLHYYKNNSSTPLK